MPQPSPWARFGALLVLAGSLATAVTGCRATPRPGAAGGPQPSAATTDALPALKLTDDTPNLLLTWIGEEGDFHVEEAISKVPEARRSRVRVVVTDQAQGSGQSVYVADLTVKREDGSYAVNSMPRSEWEKLGADLRKTRMEALAPGAKPEGTPEPGDPAASGTLPGSAPGAQSPGAQSPGAQSPGAQPNLQEPPALNANGKVTAIIYGASWCKPCHDAQRYLESLGVAVTKKDIEESRAAQAEMQQKLARANRGGSSIPVIDLMGRIFVGYSPGSLKQAVDDARHAGNRNHG